MRKLLISILTFILTLPIIFAETSVVRSSINWSMVFLLIILPIIIILAFLFFFAKKLDFDISKIIGAFKPTKWKVITSIILVILFLLFISQIRTSCYSKPVYGQISDVNIPTKICEDYSKYKITQGCFDSCISLRNLILYYFTIILIPFILIYVSYSILSILFRKQKI